MFHYTEDSILEGDNPVAAAIVIAGRLIADQLKYLGNGDAATTMGAIEGLGLVLEEGIERLAGSIESLKQE